MNATTADAPLVPDITLRLRGAGGVRRAGPMQDRVLLLALLAALALHAAILTWLYLRPEPAPQPGPPDDAITVEILPSARLPHPEPAPAPAAPAPSARPETAAPAGPRPQAAPPAAPPAEPPMIRPATLLSARRLAAPGSRPAQRALRTLSDDTRAEQLCGLEAMEQVHAWRRDFQPDRLVAYAMGEPKTSGTLVEADGAAFRSRAAWYRIRFRCELTPDYSRVASFAFAVGDPVPREEWEEHGLPAVH